MMRNQYKTKQAYIIMSVFLFLGCFYKFFLNSNNKIHPFIFDQSRDRYLSSVIFDYSSMIGTTLLLYLIVIFCNIAKVKKGFTVIMFISIIDIFDYMLFGSVLSLLKISIFIISIFIIQWKTITLCLDKLT